MISYRHIFFALALPMGLAACGSNETILTGERLDIRGESTAQPVDRAVSISLPAARNLGEWTHAASNARHLHPHGVLASDLSPVWAANIGQASDRKHRITATPVSDGRLIFTIDSRALLVATNTSGARVWEADLTPASDKADDASGGALAVVDGTVYAATGFGTLHAIDARTGNRLWRQRLDAGIAGAPVVRGDQVYLTTRDSRGMVLTTEHGRLRWQVEGAPSSAGVTGGAGPAIGDKFAIFPFSSGQVSATYRREGFEAWESSVTGGRLGVAYARIADITGDPVISGNRVYLGNPGGRIVALDLETGARLWTAEQGAMGPVVVAGGSIFSISDNASLVRLNAANGQHIWSSDLPNFQPARNERRQRDVYPHFGPILAGDRIWVASGDGVLRGFNPRDGLQTAQVALPAGAATAPIVVGGTMYVVTTEGQLIALR